MHARLLIPMLLVAVAGGLWLALREPARGGPGADRVGYVGRQRCADCHAAEHDAWLGSHHDHAMAPADEDSVLGDFDDATFEHRGVTSRFFRRDGVFMVNTEGPDGAMADFEVQYVFGVDPLQQYLVPFEGGRFQVLSLCWDARPHAAGGQRWFHLYPDERITHVDPLHWTGLNHNWNSMCAECHSTHLEKRYDAAAERYDTRWSEIDVACEACHGPGAAHVAAAERVAAGSGAWSAAKGLLVRTHAPAAWAIEPGAVTATRTPATVDRAEVESCAPCHSRRTGLADPAAPGRPLLDTHRPALLDEGLYHADGQILGEVYVYGSFAQSAMYRQGVTCSDCHDPHSLQLRAPGNALCVRCHLASHFDAPSHHHHTPGTAGAACVSCHMPATTYMVVDPRRDHSLRVPRPDLTVGLGTPNACNGCHDDRPAQWAADAIAQWSGAPAPPHWAPALAAGRQGAPGSRAALVDLIGDPAQPALVRATALSLLERTAGPPPTGTVRAAAGDADPVVRLGAALAADGLPPAQRVAAVGGLLDDPTRAVRTEAARALAMVPAEELPPGLAARHAAALAEYRAVQDVHKDQPWAHVNLALLHLQNGDLGAAEAAYRAALRRAPWSVRAAVNLADLYRQQGRETEGERVLRDCCARFPQAADAHHALGLLLVRTGRSREALESLERAAQLAPENPRLAYVFGVALQSLGDPARARQVLEQAQRRHPGDRDLLLALVTLLRDSGDRAAAIGYARALLRLAPDAGVARLLRELEGGG